MKEALFIAALVAASTFTYSNAAQACAGHCHSQPQQELAPADFEVKAPVYDLKTFGYKWDKK